MAPLLLRLDDFPQAELLGEPRRDVDDEDLHLGVVHEVGKELGGEEEVSVGEEEDERRKKVRKGRKKDALPDAILARSLNQHLVHRTLGTLIHTLVDLVDEGEGSAGEFGESEKVGDGREGAFLREVTGQDRRAGKEKEEGGRTYTSGLTVTGEDVKDDVARVVLLVTERDHDLDTPLLVVLVLSETDFAEKTESCRKGNKRSMRNEGRKGKNVLSKAAVNLLETS